MADIAAKREREIDRMLDQLASEDAAERREAAYWMGEAAVADAVPQLVDLYEHDDNAGVRAAADYALGMFRAVEETIKRGKEKKVVRLLERVEKQGKLGRRANKGGWVRLVLGLLIAFVAFAAAYRFMPEALVQTAQTSLVQAGLLKITPNTDRETLLRSVRERFTAVKNDTTTLQTQFQTALGGGTFDCASFFNIPTPFEMTGADAVAYPDIAQIVRQVNTAQNNLAAAYARFDAACLEVQALPAGEIGPTYGILVNAIQALPEIESALSAAEGREAAAPAADVTSVPEIAPTSGPPTAIPPTATNPPPTTEIRVADPRSHLANLYGILDDVTGQRGALTLLEQYWGDMRRSGTTAACSSTVPTIPENYVLPTADGQASSSLAQAVGLINEGLELTRTGWTDFTFACNSENVIPIASQELMEAGQARALFLTAEQALNIVRDAI
jgi:hypothetical protein